MATRPVPLRAMVAETLRVPRVIGDGGDGAPVARQLDAVLAGVGFTCSRALIEHLAGSAPGPAMDRALDVIAAARELVGDQVQHNAYFRDFPAGVPDTIEFWLGCLRDAVLAGEHLVGEPIPDLLELPGYGRYQHTFDELVAAHDELVASAGDRLTVLHLGGTVDAECRRTRDELAGSTTPLTPGRRALLVELVEAAGADGLPEIPVAENRAVVDAVGVGRGEPPSLCGSVTDVLRVAAALSGADPALVEPPRFRGIGRPARRLLLAALDDVVRAGRDALGDVPARREQWKRLGERLHPHEHPQWPHAREVFAVARGEVRVGSPVSRAESLAGTDPVGAARALPPGMLIRWTDRLLRTAADGETLDALIDEIRAAVPRASGRVLCSLRDHVEERRDAGYGRLFVTRHGTAHAEPEGRRPLPAYVLGHLRRILDDELRSRMPAVDLLVVDPEVLNLALPLSGRASADGFGVMPRGTSAGLPDGDTLRFFVHWREARRTTDFDLSLLLLDHRLGYDGHVSWTELRRAGIVHSGDVTSSAGGATEFIDVPLADVRSPFLVPQVNVYSGEGFDEVADSLFGWMVRDASQAGMPFEPRTVRARSELRGGGGRVALPAVFGRHPSSGRWSMTWLNLYLRGSPAANTVEGNRSSTAGLIGTVLRRHWMTVRYLVDLMSAHAGEVRSHRPGATYPGPVTYVGIERPDGLPDGSDVITLNRLSELVPR